MQLSNRPSVPPLARDRASLGSNPTGPANQCGLHANALRDDETAGSAGHFLECRSLQSQGLYSVLLVWMKSPGLCREGRPIIHFPEWNRERGPAHCLSFLWASVGFCTPCWAGGRRAFLHISSAAVLRIAFAWSLMRTSKLPWISPE